MLNQNTLKNIFTKKNAFRCILLAVLPAGLFYAIALATLSSQGFGIMQIIRDPSQQNDTSSFIGFLSNIGIWLWVSSASICFFTITKNKLSLSKSHKELLRLTGALLLLLAIDDFFMIHDRYINQKICYVVYALLAISILIRHYKLIIKIEGFGFILAGLFLALSIFTDLIQSRIPMRYEYTQIFEEGFKFLGAATWLYFNANAASYSSTQVLAD